MADPVTWKSVAAVLADADVSSQTKAALLDAYAVAVPSAMADHTDAFRRYGGLDSATPAGTPPRSGPFYPGVVDNAPLAPELGGLGLLTAAAPSVGRWTDTRDVLAQAALEADSVGKVATWEKKLAGGPSAVDTADELLAAGSGGLQFFRLFLPAYNRLVKSAVPLKFADYKKLYEAEHGLDFSVFLADAGFVERLSVLLTQGNDDLGAARDRLASWGGEAGSGARAHLSAIIDRTGTLIGALSDGDAPTALSGLLTKGVGTLQNAVLQKAATVAALKSTTVFRSPALTPADIDVLIVATEPDATDDELLDAAVVMRADQLPTTSLLNPAVRLTIRAAAHTWTEGFLHWFAAVDQTLRTACSTAGTAVEQALKTMAHAFEVQLPDTYFGGIALVQIGVEPPTTTGDGGQHPGGTPPVPVVGDPGTVLDPLQQLAGRPPGTGWVDPDDALPPGWYVNPVTGEVGPLFPTDGQPPVGDPLPRPDWLPNQYGYLTSGVTLPDGWTVDPATGELLAPAGFVAGTPAPVQIDGATGTISPSDSIPGGYQVTLRDAAGVMHQHLISYDAVGHPVIGEDIDGVSQLSDLSSLDDHSGADAAVADGSAAVAGLGDGGAGMGGFDAADLADPGVGAAADSSLSDGDPAGTEPDSYGLTDPAATAAPTVMPAPPSWSPDSPATNLSSSGGASVVPAVGAPLTAAASAAGQGGSAPFLPMMPMMPMNGDNAKTSSRYQVPSAPSELIDEDELAEIERMGPVIGSRE